MKRDFCFPAPLKLVLLAVLLFVVLTSCTPAATPAIEIVPVVNTVEVTREVTSEVTRLVEILVTNTPTPTPFQTAIPSSTPSKTRIPSITPTWDPPRVSILEHSACFYGPSRDYLFKYGLNATVWMRVIGRNSDGSWLFIKAGNDPDWNGCWIETTGVEFLSGDVSDVPVYWMGLPGSTLYLPPVSVSANRVGNEVTVFWEAVWMTEDDYRGYLIEAWVCQGGRQVFLAIGHPAPLPLPLVTENVGTFAVKIVDETGCLAPSNARIYSVEKHGYTSFRVIPWPTYEPTPIATRTSNP
jgi:hypothetical protein